MRPRTLLIFIASVVVLAETAKAVNFTQCLAEVQSGKFGAAGAVDAYGNQIPSNSLNTTVGLSYELCLRACGGAPESFDWGYFATLFTAWLLPWLALISQLPFGSKQMLDNLISMFLAVGSPTLAGYSLALTVLNKRYAAHQLSGIMYPNAKNAFRVLNSLQQAALHVDATLLSSLVVLSQNDEWWKDLVERLDYVHTWSIPAATSIAWVFIAYIVTVLDSILTLTPNSGISNGLAVGSVWLWLLAVVIGWLQISPKCDHQTVKIAICRVNNIAYVARESGEPTRASEVSEERGISVREDGCVENEDGARDDEFASTPIYNYARFFPWSKSVEVVAAAFKNADSRAQSHMHPNSTATWCKSEREGEIHPLNRTGTYSEVIDYCADMTEVRTSHWGPDSLGRFFLAALAGLALQWGTSGGAIIIIWFTPTQGLGCHSASYILYSCLSTLVWIFLVTSSALVHHSLRLPKGSRKRHFLRMGAVVLRRGGKLLATLNTLWIILSSLLQFSNMYDTCFCNVQLTLMLKHVWNGAYMIVDVANGNDVLLPPWIGGNVFGCAFAILFVIFVSLLIHPTL